MVAKLRSDEKLLESVISEGKLLNQEKSSLKDGQTLKDVAPLVNAPSRQVKKYNVL